MNRVIIKILRFVGLAIILFQLYKYFTNQLFDSNLELVLFVIGLLLATSPQRLIKIVSNKLSTNNKNENG